MNKKDIVTTSESFNGTSQHDTLGAALARRLRQLAVRCNVASDAVLARHNTDLLDDEFEAFFATQHLARLHRQGDSEVRDIARKGLFKALTRPRCARSAIVALFGDETPEAHHALEATMEHEGQGYHPEWVLAMEEIDTVDKPEQARRAEKILERLRTDFDTHHPEDKECPRRIALFLAQLRANERMKSKRVTALELTIGGNAPG